MTDILLIALTLSSVALWVFMFVVLNKNRELDLSHIRLREFCTDFMEKEISRIEGLASKIDANTCRIKTFEETKLEAMQEELKQQQAMTDGMNSIFGYNYNKAVKAGEDK